MIEAQPTAAGARIVSLDVLRGFALLGILLLNIVGMGMLSTAYYNPFGGGAGAAVSQLDLRVWMLNELFAEGAMRALFSMLFGAGVVLFAETRSAQLHYRRTFWLLCFGLFDGYVLLWVGDILVVYAIAGALLYQARNAPVKNLLLGAAGILTLLMLVKFTAVWSLGEAKSEYEQLAATAETAGTVLTAEQETSVAGWLDFKAGGILDEQKQAQELADRGSSYIGVLSWAATYFTEAILVGVPTFMLWDALAMMLLGMALFKLGVLQGLQSRVFYAKLACAGFAVGLSINAWELWRSAANDYDLVTTFAFIQPTYDLGRTAMALGYIGLLIWWCKGSSLKGVLQRLAAVGRMALTNYLMHSLIALLIFTGAGFGLVGTLDRWMLYPIVLLIWLFQLWFSPWWLARHAQGPLEALWRRLTYQT